MKLIEAAIDNNAQRVRAELEQGVDPNVYVDHAEVTPLHFAAQSNAIDVVPLLIAGGANIHAKLYPDGQRAIDIARLFRHEKMVQLLEDLSLRSFSEANEQYRNDRNEGER